MDTSLQTAQPVDDKLRCGLIGTQRQPTKIPLLMYLCFGFLAYVRIGDAYIYETMVGAPNNENSTIFDSKGLTPDDATGKVFPSFYIINCLVSLPIYYAVLKYNMNKLGLVVLALASVVYATLFSFHSIFDTSYTTRLIETIVGECSYGMIYALEPAFFAYAFYAVRSSTADDTKIEDRASSYSRLVYTAAQGLACLMGYGILALMSTKIYLHLWKIQLGLAAVALTITLFMPSTELVPGNTYDDFSIAGIRKVYFGTTLRYSAVCVGLHFSMLIVIGYVTALWYNHAEYAQKSVALNGIVFALSWISGSLFTALADTAFFKHQLVMSIQLALFAVLPYTFVLSMDISSIWAPYSLYIFYMGIGQSLLGVIYAKVYGRLESHKQAAYFTAIYGINQWISFIVCCGLLMLPYVVNGYTNGCYATFYLTSSISGVLALLYLIPRAYHKLKKQC